MKQALLALVFLVSASASANDLLDILDGLNDLRGGIHHGPGHGPGRPGGPGHGGPGHGPGGGHGPGHPGGPGGYPGGPGGPGNITCNAVDAGFEEHPGGHFDCFSCLSRHGQCIETCSANEYVVTVQGEVYDFNTRRTYLQPYYGYGQDQWAAENDAFRQCQWARAERCGVVRRDFNPREISRNYCR